MLMPWSRTHLITLMGLSLTLSCGRSRREIDTTMPPSVAKPVLSLAPPLSYELADPDCQGGAGLAQLTASEVRSWQGQAPEAQLAEFTNTSSVDTLNDDTVALTTFGDSYQRSCDFRRGQGLRCLDPSGRELMWREAAIGKSLKICRDRFAYPRRSYEAVALSSLHHLQSARNLYLAVAGPGTKAPPPLRLSVLATFMTDLSHYPIKGDDGPREGTVRTYVTDNLAYFPDAQMLTVFPIRESEASLLNGYFWESAFVLAHEYAHHIDLTRHAGAMATLGLRWQPMLHGYEAGLTASVPGSQLATIRMAGAMAEAFADLVGFYAAGAKEEAVIGLPYIGRDRVVTYDKFRGGSPKVLTLERLDTLLGGAKMGDDLIDFGDIHASGAVIAHTLDRIFLELTQSPQQSRTVEGISKHFKLALTFMDIYTDLAAASRTDGQDLSKEVLLSPLSEAIQRLSTDYLANDAGQPATDPVKVKRAICEIVRDQIPALTIPPFAEDNHC